MKVFIVERISREGWLFTGPTEKMIEAVFQTRQEAELYIRSKPKETINSVKYMITECEMGIDMAVGYDMTALTAYCGVCGNPVDPTENYCSQCGTKLNFDMEKWNELISEIDKRRKK